MAWNEDRHSRRTGCPTDRLFVVVNNNRGRVANREDNVSTTTLSIVLTLTVSRSVRTPNLCPELLVRTSPRSHGRLIEGVPKCVQHCWFDEIATPDHEEAQLLQRTSSQALSMPFVTVTSQGPLLFSGVP